MQEPGKRPVLDILTPLIDHGRQRCRIQPYFKGAVPGQTSRDSPVGNRIRAMRRRWQGKQAVLPLPLDQLGKDAGQLQFDPPIDFISR